MAKFILAKDNIKLGALLGILGPMISLVVIHRLNFSSISLFEFLDYLVHNNKFITSIGSLCLISNAVIFTIYINTNRDNTAKGVFYITLVFGIAMLLMKVLN